MTRQTSHDEQEKDALKVHASPEEQQELWEKVEKIRFAMLTTRTPEGALGSRPMTLQQVEGDGTLWFFTSGSTELRDDITRDASVNVAFADPGDNLYVSISGSGYFVDDREKVEELWNPMAAAWYPGGPADPDLWLLRIDPDRVDYWTPRAGKIVQMIAMAKAAITRTLPGPGVGEHGTFAPRGNG
jgi:general stress protein 26